MQNSAHVLEPEASTPSWPTLVSREFGQLRWMGFPKALRKISVEERAKRVFQSLVACIPGIGGVLLKNLRTWDRR